MCYQCWRLHGDPTPDRNEMLLYLFEIVTVRDRPAYWASGRGQHYVHAMQRDLAKYHAAKRRWEARS